MASRLFQFQYSYERDLVHIHAKISIGATGAPTLSNAKGIASIIRNSAGNYTLTLKDNYYLFMGLHAQFLSNGGAPAAPIVAVDAEDVDGDKTIDIVCYDADTPAATDPANGEVMLLHIILRSAST